jgi:peptide/nickel transport system substrate-binding protein
MANRLRALVAVVVFGALVAGGWWWIRRNAGAPDKQPAVDPNRVGRGGELTASIRSEPSSYNRYVAGGSTATGELLALLTHGYLARVNRTTDELEPSLAARWTQSSDGLAYTIALRPDVLFSFQVANDERVKSPLRAALQVGGQPLDVSAPDRSTVVIRFPIPFAPGLRLLDSVPILPKHRLAPSLAAGTFASEWTPAKPLSDIAGLGPFVLTEHRSGQRLVLTRNPHYFRRDVSGAQLPYLDKLTLAVIPDQNAEALRLQARDTDLMANGDIRPRDHSAFSRLRDQERIRLFDVGIGLDPDFLWFNLTASRAATGVRPWLQRKEFRQALSSAIDRQAIANAVYLGAAVPIFGPVSPGNARWYARDAPTYPYDLAKARRLLAGLGLLDRNGDGMLEDSTGQPVQFSMLSQTGHIRGETAAAIQEQLRQFGITVNLVLLDPGGLFQRWAAGDYETIYFGHQASSTDPALNRDFWLSSGNAHWWNPGQPAPATEWERRIDELMRKQASAPDVTERQRAFGEVQKIMGEELPAIYFVAPRVTVATSMRVLNATPALQVPQLLWSADTLAASRSR